LEILDEICSFNPQKNLYICCNQVSDLKAKMHPIRFRLKLRPRPHWGSLQRSPDLLVGFKGLTSKGGGGNGGEWEGGGERSGGNNRKGKMRGNQMLLHTHVRNPKKCPDCRPELIGGGGNTDVCPRTNSVQE